MKSKQNNLSSQTQREHWWLPEAGVGDGQISEGSQNMDFGYKISHRDVTYILVTLNCLILCI